MGHAKTEIIADLVAEEVRAENVSEYAASGNQPLRLMRCLADILDELATPSFFPEHRRVVVVQDLHELTAKATKETAPLAERLAAFLRDSLAEIGNAAIFVVREESDRWKRVLFKAIEGVGEVRHFPAENLNFAFQDALLARDVGEAMRIIDRRLEQARATDQLAVLRSMFAETSRITRLLLQAKALRRGQGADPAVFPDEKRLNLLMQHAFVQKKVRAAAGRFRTPALIALRRELQRASRHFAPSLDDVYVADQRLLLEHLLTRLCAQDVPAVRGPLQETHRR
jgi:DNA polymerase III delta subunit